MAQQKDKLDTLTVPFLLDVTNTILKLYLEGGGEGGEGGFDDSISQISMNDNTLKVCELLGDELIRRQIYVQAIDVYTLILKREEQPIFYIKRAQCYKECKKYVEAARDLTDASNLAPDMRASISSRQYYEQIEHYYKDLDIKFW